MNQSLKQFVHIIPTLLPCPVQNSREKKWNFIENLILSTHQTVNLMVHQLQVNLHQLIRHSDWFIICKEFRDNLECRYFYYFITIFGERKQCISQGLLLCLCELNQLGDYLHTSLPDTPNFLETFLEVKVFQHFFIKEAGRDILAENSEFSDDLFFDSDTGLIVKFDVLFGEEFLVFLMA